METKQAHIHTNCRMWKQNKEKTQTVQTSKSSLSYNIQISPKTNSLQFMLIVVSNPA